MCKLLAFFFEQTVIVYFLYFGRNAFFQHQFLSKLIYFLVNHQRELSLQLLIHLLTFLHEVDIVVAIFLQEQGLDDVDQMLQNFVDYSLQRLLTSRREGFQNGSTFNQFLQGLGTLGPRSRRISMTHLCNIFILVIDKIQSSRAIGNAVLVCHSFIVELACRLYGMVKLFKRVVWLQILAMFSRNFMKVFPIRKYGDITARAGSISTDMWLHSTREIRIQRPFVYILTTAILLVMFDNFHTADEIFGISTRPYSSTNYENDIPKEVLYPNLSIIEGFEAINKMKELQETLSYEKL